MTQRRPSLGEATQQIQAYSELLYDTGQDPGRVQLYMGDTGRWWALLEYYESPNDEQYTSLGAASGQDAAEALVNLAMKLTKSTASSARSPLRIVKNFGHRKSRSR